MVGKVVGFIGSKFTHVAEALLGGKIQSDLKFLLKISLFNNVSAVIIPTSIGLIAYSLLSIYTNYDKNLIILSISTLSLFAVICLIIHNKVQFRKRVDGYRQIANLAKSPVDDLKVFANPFIRQLVLEHKKMKQSKEIS